MTVKWGEMKWNLWNLVKLDRENQPKDLLNSLKSQSLWTYPAFRPRDRFAHLEELLMVLIVVKSVDTSMIAHIRINFFEFRQRSVRVTCPHVLLEFKEYRVQDTKGRHRHHPGNLPSCTPWTQGSRHPDSEFKTPRVDTVIMDRYPNFGDFPYWIRRVSLHNSLVHLEHVRVQQVGHQYQIALRHWGLIQAHFLSRKRCAGGPPESKTSTGTPGMSGSGDCSDGAFGRYWSHPLLVVRSIRL